MVARLYVLVYIVKPTVFSLCRPLASIRSTYGRLDTEIEKHGYKQVVRVISNEQVKEEVLKDGAVIISAMEALLIDGQRDKVKLVAVILVLATYIIISKIPKVFCTVLVA